MHHHRAEHWVVVRGTALVEKNGVEELIGENQSTYIPLGAQHRLSKPGKIPVEMIEIKAAPTLAKTTLFVWKMSTAARRPTVPEAAGFLLLPARPMG